MYKYIYSYPQGPLPNPWYVTGVCVCVCVFVFVSFVCVCVCVCLCVCACAPTCNSCVFKRALSFIKRALFFIKRALHSVKTAPCTCQKSPLFCQKSFIFCQKSPNRSKEPYDLIYQCLFHNECLCNENAPKTPCFNKENTPNERTLLCMCVCVFSLFFLASRSLPLPPSLSLSRSLLEPYCFSKEPYSFSKEPYCFSLFAIWKKIHDMCTCDLTCII